MQTENQIIIDFIQRSELSEIQKQECIQQFESNNLDEEHIALIEIIISGAIIDKEEEIEEIDEKIKETKINLEKEKESNQPKKKALQIQYRQELKTIYNKGIQAGNTLVKEIDIAEENQEHKTELHTAEDIRHELGL
jgi:hypothetical protein